MSISYQEKSVYVNFVILLAMFGGYLGYAISLRSPIRLGGPLLLLITLQIIGNAILAATSRRRLVDERDRIIKARARQVGYVVLLVFIWTSFGYLSQPMVSSRIVSNLLVMALVVAELSGLVTQIIFYRAST